MSIIISYSCDRSHDRSSELQPEDRGALLGKMRMELAIACHRFLLAALLLPATLDLATLACDACCFAIACLVGGNVLLAVLHNAQAAEAGGAYQVHIIQ